mmetsp:Transcript_21446/g.38159  ORF Transcript_21446/g.38159 Transcript_21446/m.38159 type:complete len:271 (-) Transcript_21446:522-1334(-)
MAKATLPAVWQGAAALLLRRGSRRRWTATSRARRWRGRKATADSLPGGRHPRRLLTPGSTRPGCVERRRGRWSHSRAGAAWAVAHIAGARQRASTVLSGAGKVVSGGSGPKAVESGGVVGGDGEGGVRALLEAVQLVCQEMELLHLAATNVQQLLIGDDVAEGARPLLGGCVVRVHQRLVHPLALAQRRTRLGRVFSEVPVLELLLLRRLLVRPDPLPQQRHLQPVRLLVRHQLILQLHLAVVRQRALRVLHEILNLASDVQQLQLTDVL